MVRNTLLALAVASCQAMPAAAAPIPSIEILEAGTAVTTQIVCEDVEAMKVVAHLALRGDLNRLARFVEDSLGACMDFGSAGKPGVVLEYIGRVPGPNELDGQIYKVKLAARRPFYTFATVYVGWAV